ncbi:VWA domain-containing protein [Mycolicibacterium grossiae]|uniref:VWFA domain-containing protein n=1 Tax=Mycolicibacterium grossiae TaxID=1552759 RepID=A0A1E8QC45_9MYCO|nr:VWA domain-containing protein [Mycolicibacterium grossiae]OFJ55519.1 hypothetical protein BEL07_01000 [Mycolicibacterium grossiae]QEM45148.1 VWA domain-containing protein [Mycolicibacterium grossiae]
MTLPVLGALSLTAFEHPWFLLNLGAVAVLLAAYVVLQRRRGRRVLSFPNFAVLDTVAPTRRRPLRHVPAALTIAALAALTVAMAAPRATVRIPQNRAVVMLVIDVSESMAAVDVAPNRLAAAKAAGKAFAEGLSPGIHLGLVAFAGTATVLAPPTTDRQTVEAAIDGLQTAERTATGEGILTALQAISATDALLADDGGPPPARIVLESDGAETVPNDPEAPRGAFTAARTARDQGVAISTVSFGTPRGVVDVNGESVPVPVDDTTLQKICDITGGKAYHAASERELEKVYDTLQTVIGYQTVPSDTGAGWTRLGALVLAAAALATVLINRRLPA